MGKYSEWALLDTIVDYLKEHEKEEEFIIRKTPKDYKKVADWLLETENRYYIIETKTYLDDKILKKAISQIRKEAQELPDNKETWGIGASRFSEIRLGVLLFKLDPGPPEGPFQFTYSPMTLERRNSGFPIEERATISSGVEESPYMAASIEGFWVVLAGSMFR